MAEFWILSNFLRQHSFENAEIHKLCKSVAAKHWEKEKNDLRAINAREENIILKLDLRNLKQVYAAAIEVIEAQSIAEAILSEYYDEELKMSYGMDQQEKIYEYDELKAELETRESISMYEELYNRKIEMANKMEERQIMKKYRHEEEVFLRCENDCVNLEANLKAIKAKIDEVQAAIQESILQLVKGSKELNMDTTRTLPSEFSGKRQLTASIENKAFDKKISPKRPGLSSRLSIKFRPAKIPSAIVAPRIQALNPIRGFDRLLQEAEIFRKSVPPSPDISPPKVATTSIISKETKAEKPRKKVTFDIVTSDEPPMDIDHPPDEIQESLKVIPLELTELAQKPVEKIEILENILIKPPGVPLPIKIRKDDDLQVMAKPDVPPSKRKIEIDHVFSSPPKKKRDDSDVIIVDGSHGTGNSTSFMDMFMELSKDSSVDVSSSVSASKETVAPCASEKKKPTTDDAAVVEESKEKVSFQGFEEFFASLTNKDTQSNDNDEFPKGDNNFDFFDCNVNTADSSGDCGEDGFSFQF